MYLITLADQLTLHQLGADYAHHITTRPHIFRPSYVTAAVASRNPLSCSAHLVQVGVSD